jgi:DNA modification methylase
MVKTDYVIEQVNINDLIPAEYNPRKGSPKQYDELKKSMERFGMVDPIIVNKAEERKNIIIGGHFRYKVARDIGLQSVPVVYIDVPDLKKEQELNLRLNKNTGEFDFDLLANIDEQLLVDVGFTSEELDRIFQINNDEKDDVVPEVQDNEFDVKRGDIWKLGNHRLMCGDSTNAGDVALLMDGKRSGMIHTDPPYNVDYGVSKNPRHKIRTIENDKQSPEEWENFCKSLFQIFKDFNDGDIYMWGASSGEGMRMRLWLIESGCHWSATIIWKKQQLVLSPAKYQRIYEPCFYGWFNKSSFVGDRKQTEVWEIDRPLDSKLHPTMKPVELCQKAILNSSEREQIVLDLFLGSGSTLIACEKTARICYGMEISEHYCSVIIKRWQDFTGQKAEKV